MNNRKVINNSCYNAFPSFSLLAQRKEAKRKGVCGGGKKSFPSRRPAGGTTHSASLCIVLSPQPCYGRRIFSFTPHVSDMTLTTCEIQRLLQWQNATMSTEVTPCNLLFSFLCFVSFFFSGRRKKERNEGKNFYYHTNHLGSTAFVTDQSQNITQCFLYAPFGEITTEYNSTFGNDIIPKYSFNAKELDDETGMYYYEARYYKPPVFTSRDPMFEKYFWMSPYAYCANNPVKYVDPSGGKVEPAGEEEAKAYNELKENVPDHVRAELTRLENAEEVFRIRMGKNITCNDGRGNFCYNTTTEEFDINILEGGEFSTMEKLSHELKHADQYLDRKIGFNLRELTGIKGDIAIAIPYDRQNEYEAYERQASLFVFGKEVYRQTILERYRYLPECNPPITIDNINTPKYNFQSIKNYNSISYKKYGKPIIMYHGWKKDIEKEKK